MRSIKALGLMVLLTACASSGVIQVDPDTYLVAKRSPQLGFGAPVGATADVYKEANAFCARQGKSVETVNLDQENSAFGRPASASLKFRCVAPGSKPVPPPS